MKDPYIWTDKGYLSTQKSNEIIQRFESDNINKYQGQVGEGEVHLEIKNTCVKSWIVLVKYRVISMKTISFILSKI